MGNSASKKAKAQLERDYAQTTAELAARDQELARANEGLELSKGQQAELAKESEALREKYAELNSLSTALEQEREKHINKLQIDIKSKGDEVIAQRRVVEARTRERDDARVQVKQIEEQMALSEQKSQLSTAELERRRRSLENSAQTRQQELDQTRAAEQALAEKVKLLEEKHEELSAQFDLAKSTAEEKLSACRVAAEQELSSARSNAADELAIAKSSMSESARNLTSVSTELARTKSALQAATSRLDSLTIDHNESVSRRAASHEAFTAIKQELVEAQERYLGLYEAHEKQGRDLQEHMSAAQQKEKLAQENESITKALAAEREDREALKAELAALRKKLADTEASKSLPDVRIHELHLGSDVPAAA